MTKHTDLVSYLPRFLAEYQELNAALTAENPEFDLAWDKAENILNNEFIETADDTGLARWEKMLGITPYATDTLEDRRFRILARYNEDIPYTRRSLEHLLTTLCGKDGYQMTITAMDYTAIIKVALTAKKQEAAVRDLLNRMLPCNMKYSVSLLYNQWETVKPHTWGGLSSLTWRKMKEEVLS